MKLTSIELDLCELLEIKLPGGRVVAKIAIDTVDEKTLMLDRTGSWTEGDAAREFIELLGGVIKEKSQWTS